MRQFGLSEIPLGDRLVPTIWLRVSGVLVVHRSILGLFGVLIPLIIAACQPQIVEVEKPVEFVVTRVVERPVETVVT